jgi:predicted aspartyl protease
MKTRRCGILTSVEAAKVMMAWRARTPTVRSGAAAASDMALDGTRGEAAVGLSARSAGTFMVQAWACGSHVEMAR